MGLDLIYDIDNPFREHMFTAHPLGPPVGSPAILYYATLCDFYSLVKRLILVRPGDVKLNARGGYLAALSHPLLAKGKPDIVCCFLSTTRVRYQGTEEQTLLCRGISARTWCKCQR